jgi:hypothetical protein
MDRLRTIYTLYVILQAPECVRRCVIQISLTLVSILVEEAIGRATLALCCATWAAKRPPGVRTSAPADPPVLF